jgi:hypothetical protein
VNECLHQYSSEEELKKLERLKALEARAAAQAAL